MNIAFNQIMPSMIPLHVYLKLKLDDEQVRDLARGPDEMGRLYFYVKDNEAGMAYLVHIGRAKPEQWFSAKERSLSGYFEVFQIAGPHQGILTINLRPFAPTLKRCQ